MARYSHSKLSTFEQCPFKYKLKYIDKVKVEVPLNIEQFMGDLVHRVLEKLYSDVLFLKIPSLDFLISYYRELWEKEYFDGIVVVKEGLNASDYFNIGEKILRDFYAKNYPFNQLKIIGIETKDKLRLPDGNFWDVRIDLLACDEENNYYVIDYKTSSKMKDQAEADRDRQLAMYSVWVKDNFRNAKSISLVWKMLAFNTDVISQRNDEQINALLNEVVTLIEKINNTEDFKACPGPLCHYCEYGSICPSFKHNLEISAKKSVFEMKEDEGLKMVDEFAKVKSQLKELEEKENELKMKIIEFARQKGYSVIYGSKEKVSISESKKVVPKVEINEIRKMLKQKGLWEDYSMINYPRFNSMACKGKLDNDIMALLDIEKDWKVFLSKKKDEI